MKAHQAVTGGVHCLEDVVLARASRPCSVCRSLIPLGAVALLHRDGRHRVVEIACCHLYCRAQLRERFLMVDGPVGGYLN